MSFLDFLFPKRCVGCKKLGAYICPSCFSYITFNEQDLCCVCNRHAIGGLTHPNCKTTYAIDGVFASVVYAGIVKKLMYTFKYQPYITDLQPFLVDLFYEGLIQKEVFYKQISKDSVFLPVPLHVSKLKKRGYNQSHLLAKGLAGKFGVTVIDCLTRTKNTHTQVGLSQAQRKDNIKDAFTLKKVALPNAKKIKQVFLVDDVVTSGATLYEAAKVIKRAGVERVWGITLAHGQ